jgi:hypothetical protein
VTYGGEQKCLHGFGGGNLRKTLLGRPTQSTYEDNIKIGLEEVVLRGGVD